jgi:hypothetical protein
VVCGRFLEPVVRSRRLGMIQQGQVCKLKTKGPTASRCGHTATGTKGAARRGHCLLDAVGVGVEWEVAGASHTGGIDAHPRQYEQRVIAFFDHALLRQERE